MPNYAHNPLSPPTAQQREEGYQLMLMGPGEEFKALGRDQQTQELFILWWHFVFSHNKWDLRAER